MQLSKYISEENRLIQKKKNKEGKITILKNNYYFFLYVCVCSWMLADLFFSFDFRGCIFLYKSDMIIASLVIGIFVSWSEENSDEIAWRAHL